MRFKTGNVTTYTKDLAKEKYSQERITHWDKIACYMDSKRGFSEAYHKRIEDIYKFLIPPGLRVLEIGCGQGDLLAAVKPAVGIGADFSKEMVRRAKKCYPGFQFVNTDAQEIGNLNETFDIIILSDLVNDLWDVRNVLKELKKISIQRTRLIFNFFSNLWEYPLRAVRRLGLATPLKPQNWLTVEDMKNFCYLADMEVISSWDDILLPLHIPILSNLANCYLVKMWPWKFGALTHFLIARPLSQQHQVCKKPMVSVIIPARNEADNINDIFARVPGMGSGTELIFVEGNSTDDTYFVIEQAIKEHPEKNCKLFKQKGVGKGDAVKLGFAEASGEVLIILDADITVPPEYLPDFVEVLTSNKAEFVNGVRLVYPMETNAMYFINLAGNKFFSLAFSWLLRQSIKDTLCGTKALWKSDYELIAANRSYFGDFDPFGDFDLLFGAAKLNLKIVDLPIRYRERTYGTTNISRWKHGLLLLKMVIFAARRIKFV